MKCINYIVVVFILFTGITSCKKSFLQVEDKSIVLRQQYVKDLSSLEEFLNGIYIRLTQSLYDGQNQVYPELIADNIKPKSGGSLLVPHYKWGQQVTSNGVSVYSRYDIIKACNFVIETSPAFRSENPSRADDLKAQALAIRALVNFTLVNVYAQSYNFTTDGSHAGIALSVSADAFEPVTKRNTVTEVYTAAIDDLNTAIPLFSSDDISTTLLLNRVAAKALLSRVLLFKGDFNGARSLAREVLAKVPLMTTPNYPSKLFTLKETEALFQLAPSSSTVVAGSFSTNFQGRYFSGISSNVQFLATSGIATLLTSDPNDVRKIWIKSGGAGKDTIKKYPVNVVSGFNPTTQSYYPTIFRSSEMSLTAAECYANLNMEDSAIYFLDAIRLRANPAALPTVATGSALRDSIYVERRKELAFEGLRMFDLLRWKQGVTRGADVTNGASMTLGYPSNMAIAPIPLSEVQITGLQQNPGY
jgi:starch-binding outer membrane protein, SusD/RagB family